MLKAFVRARWRSAEHVVSCVPSKGWSDPHATRPGSVATNGISLWTGSAELAGRQLFIISVTFTGTRAGAQGELRRSVCC